MCGGILMGRTYAGLDFRYGKNAIAQKSPLVRREHAACGFDHASDFCGTA